MTEFPDVTLNEETYAWAGQRLFDQQKWDTAMLAFNMLLKANPAYPNPERVMFKVAECLEAAGKAPEAVTQFKATVDKAPESATALDAKLRMAKLCEAQEQADEAMKLYEEAANANTGDTAARARFRVAELLEAKNDFEGAARSYMRIAILFLHEELSPESLWRAGQAYEKAGSPAQAKNTYEELISDFGDKEQAIKAKERLAQMGPQQ
jgi:TolA-binding protein